MVALMICLFIIVFPIFLGLIVVLTIKAIIFLEELFESLGDLADWVMDSLDEIIKNKTREIKKAKFEIWRCVHSEVEKDRPFKTVKGLQYNCKNSKIINDNGYPGRAMPINEDFCIGCPEFKTSQELYGERRK